MIYFRADAINMDIPLLIGLDVLKKHNLLSDLNKNIVRSGDHGWNLPHSYKLGQAFLEPTPFSIYISKLEITRLHLHFYYPSTDEIFCPIQRCDPTKGSPEVRFILNDNRRSRDGCEEFGTRPYCFRVSPPPGKNSNLRGTINELTVAIKQTRFTYRMHKYALSECNIY